MTELVNLDLAWPAWLAAAGLSIMAVALMLLVTSRYAIIHKPLQRLFMRAPTMQARLRLGFSCIALIPVATLVPMIGMYAANQLHNEQVAGLDSQIDIVADAVPSIVNKRAELVAELAGHISAGEDFSKPTLLAWLLRHHQGKPDVTSMWIAGPDGQLVAATAASDGSVEAWEGPIAGVGAMDYFSESKKANGLYVSGVRKGVSQGSHPMMFVSAPISRQGKKPQAFLQAQLDLHQVFNFLVTQQATSSTTLLLTDEKNRVMFASSPLGFGPFENISGHPLVTNSHREPRTHPYMFSGNLVATGKTGRYVATTRKLPSGWRLFAVTSQSPVRNVALIPLLLAALWVPLLLLLARGLAGLYGEAVTTPLKKLDESLDVFDVEPTMRVVPMPPPDAPHEVREVYDRVRSSMLKRRESYDRMLEAVNEGAKLKQQLGELTDGAPRNVSSDNNSEIQSAHLDTFRGKIDPVTKLPGRQLFENFFAEAWKLGGANESPVALLLIGIGSKNDGSLKLVAEALGEIGGRSLDHLARIDVNEFSLVLPETDLSGALAVAERARTTVQKMLMASHSKRRPSLNLAVSSILPVANGNPNSFIEVTRRVLQASIKNGNGNIAFINAKGKIRLATNKDLGGGAANAQAAS